MTNIHLSYVPQQNQVPANLLLFQRGIMPSKPSRSRVAYSPSAEGRSHPLQNTFLRAKTREHHLPPRIPHAQQRSSHRGPCPFPRTANLAREIDRQHADAVQYIRNSVLPSRSGV